ncbi:MAG: hypothetical protein AAFZ52_16355, partial [Bacteroidota bacterium]
MMRYVYLVLVWVLFCGVGWLSAQTTEISPPEDWHPAKRTNAPLFVFIAGTDDGLLLSERLRERPETKPNNYLILNADRLGPLETCVVTNEYLNKGPKVKLQKVYLITYGDSALYERYDVIDKELFTAQVLYDPATRTTSIAELEQRLLRAEKWSVEVEMIRARALTRTRREVPERTLTVGRTFHFLQPRGADAPTGRSMGSWGLTYSRGIGDRFLFRADLGVGINFPEPDDDLQSQVFDQLDFAALLNGEDTEIDLTIDVQGGILVRGALGFDYYLTREKRLRPYVGLSLGANFTTLVEGTIDTTITIEGGDFGSLGGGFGGERPGGFGRGGFANDNEDVSVNT